MFDLFKGKVTPIDWAIVGSIVVVTLLLFSVFYLVIYGWQEKKYDSIQKELTEIRSQLKLAYNTKANSEMLQNEFDKFSTACRTNERFPAF